MPYPIWTEIDPELKKWASDKLCKKIDAVNKYRSAAKAATKEGFDKRSFQRSIENLKKKAALQGYSPEHDMTKTVPDPHTIKGHSTLYNEDGEVRLQWVKSSVDQDKMRELQKEAVAALSSDIKREKACAPPKTTLADLLNLYVLTDYHLGMMAWHEESGEDWDIKIAEEMLVKWFSYAIKSSPDSEVGILAQLGDFIHFDGLEAITPQNHNILDADSRFQKVVRVAIRSTRRIIQMLLKKHKMVHVIMAEGNHDPASSAWLRELLHALYEKEPRVNVDLSPDPYYCYEHGETSLFFHHGHKRKVANIDDVFVAKYREVFGRTKHSYAHMGHLHHIDVKETNLMIVEQHRTLAAHDAYASRGGWIPGRDAKCISYSKKYGEVARTTINPDMVRDN